MSTSDSTQPDRAPRALVVFESMFGNTRDVAKAIVDGLSAGVAAELVEVSQAPTEIDVALLIVGGPTHAFGMSRTSTRAQAASQNKGPVVSPGIGVREWLERVHVEPGRTRVAAFDTKVRSPRLPGSAASGIHRRLAKLRCPAAAKPATFRVDGTTGPLVDGELDRARRWGRTLSDSLTGQAVS